MHFQAVGEDYGIDFDGPHPSEQHDGPVPGDEISSVEVPEIEIPITQEAYQQPSRSINPLRDSEFYDIDIYSDVLQFITQIDL